MTTPREERESLKYAKRFLGELIDRRGKWKTLTNIRAEACARLRHYPAEWKVDELYETYIGFE